VIIYSPFGRGNRRTRDREIRTRDLGMVRCIKDENGKVLSEDAEISRRCQRCFAKLLNDEAMEDPRSRDRECRARRLDQHLCGAIRKDEIKEALKKMSNGKVEGLDQIPVEVWKCGSEKGLEWLT